jgi:hypothetical protein
MLLRDFLFEGSRTVSLPDAQPPSSDRSTRRRAGTGQASRRRFRHVVERPTSAPPRSFSLAILPLGSL